jgi:lipoprotein-releasing system permease protein
VNLPIFIAKRYLISKKSNNAINIISGISVVGICIGTMSLIIVLSAFNGLSSLVESLYNSFNPDLVLTIKEGKAFDPAADEIRKLKHDPDVAYFTEVMEGKALLKFNEQQCLANVKGVSSGFRQMSGFDTLVSEGRFDLSGNNVVMGKGVSYTLQSDPANSFSPVSVYAPKRGHLNDINPEDGLNELKIYTAGTFMINDEFDQNYVIANIDVARQLLDYEFEVSSIELKVKSGRDVKDVQQKLKQIAGDRYVLKNREEQNEVLYKTLRSEKLWTFIILVFILIIATVNVIGSLTMLIIEKKKDISILHNMGADMQLIRQIFLVEGMLITFIGAVTGILLGTLICWLQIRFSLVKMSEGYVVDSYPIKFDGGDFIAVSAVVLLIGFFAAWYPVRVFTRKNLVMQ